MRRFVSDALSYAPAAVLPAICSAITVIAFTRLLSTSDYGQYALIVAITTPMVMVLTQWAAQSVNRYYAEYDISGRGDEYRGVVGMLVLACLASGPLLLVAWLACIALHIELPAPALIAGAIAVVLFQAPTTLLLPILPASLRPAPYRFAVVTTAGLALVFALAASAVFGPQAAWLLWGQALAAALLLPYILFQTGITPLGALRDFGPSAKQTLARFWRYGAPVGLWMVAAGLLNLSDRYVIQWFFGSDAVGVYSANYNLVLMAFGLINGPIVTAAFPILMRRWAEGERDGARQTLGRMSEAYIGLAGGLVGGFIVVGPGVAELLLGPQFRGGASIQVPVALGAALWGAANLGHKSLEISERTGMMLIDVVVAAAVNCVLNLVFVPLYGYEAAAYTTLAGFGVYTALVWWQSRGLVPWEMRWKTLATAGAALLVGCLVADAAIANVDQLVARVVIGGAVFGCVYIIGCAAYLLAGEGVLRTRWRPVS